MDKQDPIYPESNEQPPIYPPENNTDPSTAPSDEVVDSYNEIEEPTNGTVNQSAETPADTQPQVTPSDNYATSTEAPVEPVVDTPVAAAPKKSKKPFVIVGIIALLLLLVGGSVAAYNVWYQSPDKVLIDSVVNAVKAKSITGSGSIIYTSKEADVKVAVTSGASHTNGKIEVKSSIDIKDPVITFDVKGEGRYVKDGSVFVRFTDIDKTYEKIVDAYITAMANDADQEVTPEMKSEARQSIDAQVRPIVDKINNQWIKIDSNDLKEVNEEAGKTQKCLQDAFAKIQNDTKMSDEIGALYKNNKFVVVKEELGSKNGNLGYRVDVDKPAAKAFGEGLKNTTFGKELTKCDETFFENSDDVVSEEDDSMKNQRFEVWVSRWSHELANVNFSATSTEDDTGKIKLDYSPVFNQEVTVEAPKDFMTVDELVKEFNSSVMSASEA